jgi:hypothetical protein
VPRRQEALDHDRWNAFLDQIPADLRGMADRERFGNVILRLDGPDLAQVRVGGVRIIRTCVYLEATSALAGGAIIAGARRLDRA